MRAQIRRGDNVLVLAGRERGKTGKVLRVIPTTGRATVERLNMVKRHTKPRSQQAQGGIIEKEAAMHLSNLMILCDRCKLVVVLLRLKVYPSIAHLHAGNALAERGAKAVGCISPGYRHVVPGVKLALRVRQGRAWCRTGCSARLGWRALCGQDRRRGTQPTQQGQ